MFLSKKKSAREQWRKGNQMLQKGKAAAAEQAFLEAAKSPSPLDKHYAFVKLIQLYQRLIREGQDKKTALEKTCIQDIELFPDFYEAWLLEYQNDIPSPYFPSFTVLAQIYEDCGKINQAISLCQLAIGYNLQETAGEEYPQRLKRLRKLTDHV